MQRWIFGYGSLVWRPAFEFVLQRPARLKGFQRRFYQGSTDHRGVPGAPGRVVTLLPDETSETVGAAYSVAPAVWARVMAGLDHREQGGYSRHEVELEPLEGEERIAATLYVAGPDNPNYLGPAPLAKMAETIARSRGPSGPNDVYLFELEAWLERLGVRDEHVSTLADAVRALRLGR